ncbi:MAG: hypothetical protein ACT4N4_15255 [Rhodospirillales bacterium]
MVALTLEPETGEEEFLDIGHPDIVAFLRGSGAAVPAQMARLSATDLEMARVIEDLIEVLVQRRVLMFTDLPPAAQRKLMERRRLREQITPVPAIVTDQDDLI